MRTILLLIGSNLFMTTAWYGHLKYPNFPLLLTILISWCIALPEYALQVPANRWGAGQFTTAQLKIIQEVITVCVFLLFNRFVLKQTTRWTDMAALGLIAAAVAVAMAPRWFEQSTAG